MACAFYEDFSDLALFAASPCELRHPREVIAWLLDRDARGWPAGITTPRTLGDRVGATWRQQCKRRLL
jgi:hypothetical protein